MNYRQWKKQYKKQHGYNPPSGRQVNEMNPFLQRLNTVVNSMDAMHNTSINRIAEIMTRASYQAMQAAQRLNETFAAIQNLDQDLGGKPNDKKTAV